MFSIDRFFKNYLLTINQLGRNTYQVKELG